MKKLIAILVVFAVVAGAAFAQDGSWSISGNGLIGTHINFIPLFKGSPAIPTNTPVDDHATVQASKYDGYPDAGDIRGNMSLSYTKGGLKTGLDFNQRGAIGAYVEGSGAAGNGDTYSFRASRDLANLLLANKLSAGIDTDGDGTDDVTLAFPLVGWGDLSGNYTFKNVLNGILVEAAVAKGSQQWNSVGGSIPGNTWTHNDRLSNNYLLVDVSPMAGVNVGFKLPDIFQISANRDFMDAALRRIVFGAKYAVAPIEVAFQFGLNQYGLNYSTGVTNKSNRLYLGAKYTISPEMNGGLYYFGEFFYKGYVNKHGESENYATLKIGGEFNYTSASMPLAAGLTFNFIDNNTGKTKENDTRKDKDQVFNLGISARYDVIPEYLRAKLGFDLSFPIVDDSKPDAIKAAGYTFNTEVIYNFLGTGAGDFGGTSIGIRYRIVGKFSEASVPQTVNGLNITFRWGF